MSTPATPEGYADRAARDDAIGDWLEARAVELVVLAGYMQLLTTPFLERFPVPYPSYEDRAFGGAGRDVLIGNTGGDRLIDWARGRLRLEHGIVAGPGISPRVVSEQVRSIDIAPTLLDFMKTS